MNDETRSERRALLKTAALMGAVGSVSAVPVVAYIVAPGLEKEKRSWFDFGPVQNLARDGVTMLPFKFMVKDGWVVLPRRGVVWAKAEAGDKLTVFSSICPHLGCSVSWRNEKKVFECPCHSAEFDAVGRPTAGPPTRPLTVLEHKVEGGKLLVLLPT